MEALITGLDRIPRQRTTLYDEVSVERRSTSFDAQPLAALVLDSLKATKLRISA
jgi:hypothetical protein